MHGYKLTGRGKIVLTMLVVIVALVGSLCIKGIAIASDKPNDDIKDIESSSVNIDLDVKNEIKSYVVNEVSLATNEVCLDEEEKLEYLSISVEEIKSYENKVAFLTFDDGPSQNVTPLILKTLDKYNVKATFFVLGSMCESNGDILKLLNDGGHSIGIHSYSHELNKLLESRESFLNEIIKTENIIKEVLGQGFITRLFRFPGGSFEAYKQQYIADLNDAGYVSVDWNALTGDTEYLNPRPEKLVERLKATIVDKDKIIILMHDSSSKEVTAEILPEIIEYLKHEGYEFATLK